MKKLFYFTSKALFVLKILRLSQVAKRFNQKDQVDVLDQGKIGGKCGQLIEYNTRNIFLEKSCTESGGETSPRHFSEKLKLKFNIVCFNGMPSC